MLGPLPTAPARPATKPARRAPIDPDDPFRIAARGAGPATEIDLPPVSAPTVAFEDIAPPETDTPDATSPAPPPPPDVRSARPAHRPTLVLQRPETTAAIAGLALVVHADGRNTTHLLREGRTRIGRRQGVEIPIDDPAASGDHAILRVEGGRAWLLDTSANGTVVSGVACLNDRVDVVDDTVLVIGSTAIVVQLIGSEALALLAGMG
jgi:hypothetical protein